MKSVGWPPAPYLPPYKHDDIKGISICMIRVETERNVILRELDEGEKE